jgi:hypothetical protein
MVKEKTKPALAETIAITFQVVSPELVDDNYDHELGMGIVG